MSMCESILTIALVCTVKYLHYCDYYYTLGNDSQSTPKLIAYDIQSEKNRKRFCVIWIYWGNSQHGNDRISSILISAYCIIRKFFEDI